MPCRKGPAGSVELRSQLTSLWEIEFTGQVLNFLSKLRNQKPGSLCSALVTRPWLAGDEYRYAYYLIKLDEATDHAHKAAFRDWLIGEARSASMNYSEN